MDEIKKYIIMKYEEIKIGKSYMVNFFEEEVIAKVDKYKSVVTIDFKGSITPWYNDELKHFEPIKEDAPTLELVSKAVQDLGSFTIEQTESGLIILTPIER